MSLNTLNFLLAQAGAEAPVAAPAAKGQPASWASFVPLVLLMVVFWFVLIRPQQKKAKEHAKMLTTIKSGDRVVTSSGIVGTIITVKEKTVTVRTGGDTKLEFTKGSIGEIISGGADTVES